jgi:DNA-binding NtrC family response regulator
VATAVDAMKVGALDYILKPFDISAIRQVLVRALDVRRLRMENIRLREAVGIYELGSSIAQTLRIYAAEMRERRRMRAEEKAHRLPVLLSIPLVTSMLPVMIGVLMLPAVNRTIRVILPAMAG